MKKKIAIMLTFILAAGTFTSCTAEEKVNNSSLSPTVSTSVGVSVSTETSDRQTPYQQQKMKRLKQQPKKPQFQKKQSLRNRIAKPKKKPTVGKIRRLFRQQIRFRKHNPRCRTTAGIQRTVISKNLNRLLKKKLKILLKSLCRSLQKSQRKNRHNRLQRQKRSMFSMRWVPA